MTSPSSETPRDSSVTPRRTPIWRQIPAGIWVLGFVSLLMDVSSEMIHALLPVYLVVGLGASAMAVGVIEGVAEATASIVKLFSGVLSDRLGQRKGLAALGYGMAALVKPLFPLAPTVGWIFAARFIDRIGKGIRGAPRDALVAQISPPHLLGASFGLRQSLDTVGAFLGPLLAIALMWVFANNFKAVFWVAVIPAVLAALLIIFAVREPDRDAKAAKGAATLRLGDLGKLGPRYWFVIGVGAVFTLARFSEAFLILRAQGAGLPLMFAPAVLVIMNIAYAASAYPLGVLSDRMDRMAMVFAGIILLIGADLVLAFMPNMVGISAGIILWGVHMGFTQGILSALVAENAPKELKGTAFGIFHLASGLALLAASVIAGLLWDQLGASVTFLAGACFAVLSLIGFAAMKARSNIKDR